MGRRNMGKSVHPIDSLHRYVITYPSTKHQEVLAKARRQPSRGEILPRWTLRGGVSRQQDVPFG